MFHHWCLGDNEEVEERVVMTAWEMRDHIKVGMGLPEGAELNQERAP